MLPHLRIPWLARILALVGLVVAAILAVLMAIVLVVLSVATLAVGLVLHALGWDRRLLDWIARRLDVRAAVLHFPVKEKPEVDDLEAPIEAHWTVVEERRLD